MPWLQLIVDVGDQAPQPMESALVSLGAHAVTLRDAADQPLLEPAPGETPLWQSVQLIALFDHTMPADHIASQLCAVLAIDALPPHRFELLADRQWEREWLKDFQPLRFGKHLWVCPSGQKIEDPDRGSAVVVDLDPGLAFGTGTHATTGLCLTWLDENDLDGLTVCDFGCGSGILAIAAAKLGATQVVATDIDPQALRATRDNAVKNDVADRVEILEPERLGDRSCDMVLANILAATLVSLANGLTALTKPGGTLVMSGILDAQTVAVVQTYSQWFDMLPPRSADGWSLVAGRRKNG